MNKHDRFNYVVLLVVLIVLYILGLGASGFALMTLVGFENSSARVAMIIISVILTVWFLAFITYLVLLTEYKKKLGTMKRNLIANVNHELKTPITSIKAMAYVLYDGIEKDPAKQHEYIGTIISETDRMEQLVLDMQALSKLQSQRIVFEKRKSSLDTILPPLIDRYEMLCNDLKLSFNLDNLDIGKIPKLFTAPDKLSTVFDILLNNATKYTPEGGIISMSYEIRQKKVIFCVRDTGIGVPKEDQDRIFERFYRADKSRHTTGSGLGLAIAYETLKGLHEEIWLESEQGKGSAFFFTVDVA